jgi:serine/threonine protein phosphatase PrpC
VAGFGFLFAKIYRFKDGQMKIKVTYASYSDVGNRDVNEDSVGVFETNGRYCFVLCDGLGGHGMGDIASSLTVDTFGREFGNDGEPIAFFERAFNASQDVLIAEQKSRRAEKKMKTTVTAVVLKDKNPCR